MLHADPIRVPDSGAVGSSSAAEEEKEAVFSWKEAQEWVLSPARPRDPLRYGAKTRTRTRIRMEASPSLD